MAFLGSAKTHGNALPSKLRKIAHNRGQILLRVYNARVAFLVIPNSTPLLSVVLPCLNENGSLVGCIREVEDALEKSGVGAWEIIVSDNGSTDGSVETAHRLGVRVVNAPERGYGNAVSSGIHAAFSPYVVFADADGTYPLRLVPELYRKTKEAGAALGIVSRLRGDIEKGAMPWLHRRIGTPFFTALINIIYGGELTDCGSGLRCVRRDWYLANPHSAGGMEFASENLIRASKSGAVIIEIRGGLRRSPAKRTPHLRTWRDGMRHLMFILSECPELFERGGLAACAGACLLQAVATWHGPSKIGVFDILGLHTQLLALMVAVLGTQLYFMGVLLHGRVGGNPARITRLLCGLPEEKLFFSIVGSCALGAMVVAAMVAVWSGKHFSGISAERALIGAVHFIVILGSFSLGLFGVHMTKRWGFPVLRRHHWE